MAEDLASWGSPDYARDWAAHDVQADLLALPRRMSAALVAEEGLSVNTVVDLGSGPGAYLAVFLEAFPQAGGIWVDGSETMLEMAQDGLGRFGDRVAFILGDASAPESLAIDRADVIVTSRLMHHFDEDTTRAIYRWAHRTLNPGGFLFNLDHFGAAPGWEQRLRGIRSAFIPKRPKRLAPHRHDFPLRPVPEHLEWLQAAGFEPGDVAWKSFHTALIAARKPD